MAELERVSLNLQVPPETLQQVRDLAYKETQETGRRTSQARIVIRLIREEHARKFPKWE